MVKTTSETIILLYISEVYQGGVGGGQSMLGVPSPPPKMYYVHAVECHVYA